MIANTEVVCYCVSVIDPAYRGWLYTYNVEAHNGVGEVLLVPERERALVFPDAGAAFTALRKVPKCRPKRDDGRPNRPLTAYSTEILQRGQISVLEHGLQSGLSVEEAMLSVPDDTSAQK